MLRRKKLKFNLDIESAERLRNLILKAVEEDNINVCEAMGLGADENEEECVMHLKIISNSIADAWVKARTKDFWGC